jgi:membrane-associated phospholipid phosphatase
MRASSPSIGRQEAQQPHLLTLKRLGMAAATAFVTANIWTGCPLLAVWVGSQAVSTKELSMGAVFVLAVLVFAMALLLTWLNNVYDELTGRERVERRSAWLRSMRAESERHVSRRVGITALERIVMLNVYVAVISLVVWYVLYAAPPAPTLCTMQC